MITERKYLADYYLNVPYIITDGLLLKKGIASQKDDAPQEAEDYLKEMEYRFEYECDKAVCGKVKRVFIGKLKLRCESDSDEHEKEAAETEVNAFIAYSEVTSLAILTLAAPLTDMPLHFMTEEFYRGNGSFVTPNGSFTADEYMLSFYGLTRCGGVKGLLTLDRYPRDRKELIYFTAAEEYGTQDKDTMIKPNPLLELDDISQYESAEIFVNEPMAVCILKNFDSAYRSRLYHESLIMQIIEVMLFKLTAVNRTNRRVVDELEKNGKPLIKLIEELNSQFAQTIRFWDTSNFKYLTTRNLAQEISYAFKTEEQMEIYERNQKFLEHLINIRSAQSEERESKVLNFLAIALTAMQCIPIFYGVAEYLISGHFELSDLMSTVGALGFTGVICMILIALLKKGNIHKRNKK